MSPLKSVDAGQAALVTPKNFSVAVIAFRKGNVYGENRDYK